MRTQVVVLCIVASVAIAGCKKKGGGGGGWLVGEQGLMVNVQADDTLGDGYDLGAAEQLNAIACRYLDEAWVAGNHGTLLYTNDSGASWDAHDLGTNAHLRALATQDAGPVFIAGDGVFFTATPAAETGGAQWTQISDGATQFRSIAAAQRARVVLALGDDGSVWSVENGTLVRRTSVDGARAIAISPDGAVAIAAGAGLARSFDGGATWTSLAAEGTYESVRVSDEGEALAVGARGAVAKVDNEGRVLVQTLGTSDLRTVHDQSYANRGYAAGNDGVVYTTRDGGWTWTLGPNVGRTVLAVDEIGDGHN
jgi:photosystem II stability/assembly factor-like uncharacterized protein